MATITVTADPQGRVNLPASFANKTVVIEEISDTEIHIRKTEEVVFAEEIPLVLSDRDRDAFLEMLESPAEPNEALRKLFAKYPAHG